MRGLILTLFLTVVMLAPTQAAANERARYEITIDLSWVGGDGVEHPESPHWSRLVVVAHSPRYRLFRDGDTASSGLGLVAANGRVGVLEAEIAEARRRGRAGESTVAPGLNSGAGVFEVTIEVTDDHDYVSFATMLAPSPDWFAGAASVELRDGAAWREIVVVPLFVWDAGVDSGESFTAPNLETQPRQSVRLLTHPSFLRADGVRPIGVATFRLLEAGAE